MKNEVNCLDFDYTYGRYATAGKDLSVRIYDASTNQVCIQSYRLVLSPTLAYVGTGNNPNGRKSVSVMDFHRSSEILSVLPKNYIQATEKTWLFSINYHLSFYY